LAGSTLDLMTALRNYMKFCSLTLEEALPAATSNPAGMVGIDNVCGRIKTGMRADLIVLKDKENADIDSVWAAGKRVVRYNAQAYTRR
ncbi:MAG: amidohydrolase family protein, partial [Clostridia bacterium]|nr:amidohydrolase family protein [Clostridia bacterium]